MATTLAPEEIQNLGPINVQAAIEAAHAGRTTRLIKDGESVAVLVPPEVYAELVDAAAARRRLADALSEGSEDIAAGRLVAGDVVKAKLRRWANHRT